MKITMNYMLFYPDRELRVIAQMLNNAKMLSSMSFEQMEDTDTAANVAEAQASGAESKFVYEAFLSEVDQLASQMTIVALHSLVELTLKRVLAACSPALKDVRRMDGSVLEKEFVKRGVILSNIDNFTEVDKLRKLANSIKHEGNVIVESGELERFYKQSKIFLDHLCKKSPKTNDA